MYHRRPDADLLQLFVEADVAQTARFRCRVSADTRTRTGDWHGSRQDADIRSGRRAKEAMPSFQGVDQF